MKSLPVKLTLHRGVVKGENGVVIKDGSHPYQFEILIGRTLFTSVWLNNTDDKSAAFLERLKVSLSGLSEVETEIV